mgnify:CR=1 FL=1
MLIVFGRERRVVIARELTKQYETFIDQPLGQLLQTVIAQSNQQRGEFVVMVAASEEANDANASVDELLRLLADEMPPNQAARIAARISGRPKRELYEMLMKIKGVERGE